jgi:hypothetical protein
MAKDRNTVDMVNRMEMCRSKRINTERTTVTRGRVVKEGKSRVVQQSASENMTGYQTDSKGRTTVIKNPSKMRKVEFGGETYYVPWALAG